MEADKIEWLNLPKYSTRCPMCADDREKINTKSLMVYRDEDGFDRWQCQHPGCEWEARQFRKRKEEMTTTIKPKEVDVVTEPFYGDVPDTINGHKVWWYRSEDGGVLYGKKRIDLVDENGKKSKTYRPVRIVNGQVTDIGTKYPQNKEMFNLPDVAKNTTVVIVEGEKAAELGKQVLTKAAVVTWLGGASNLNQVDWSPLKGKKVYLWPDNDLDGTGVRAMRRVAEALPVLECTLLDVSSLPPKADLGDNLTSAQIAKVFSGGETISKLGSGRMNKDAIFKQLEARAAQKITGIDWLDDGAQLPSSGVVVIEGRTGHGKTALAVNLSYNLLTNSNKVLYLSYEVPAWEILARHIRVDKPEQNLHTAILENPTHEMVEATNNNLIIFDQADPIPDNKLFSLLDTPSWEGATIIIDNIQLVPIHGSDRFQGLKKTVETLRDISHRNNCLIVLLSQLTPSGGNPITDTPRESREIHNTASCVLRIWNKTADAWTDHPIYDNLQGNFFIQVAKNRNGESGDVIQTELVNGAKIEFIDAKNAWELRPKKREKSDDGVSKNEIKKLIESVNLIGIALATNNRAF